MTPESNVTRLSRYRADLARALKRRANQLLESPTLAKDVTALTPLETYFMIKEIGTDQAVPILRHTSEEQWQACIALDCWDNDRPDLEELEAWLTPFLPGGQLAFAKAFSRLEPETQVLLLQHLVTIEPISEDETGAPPPEGLKQKATPDGYYLVTARRKHEELDPLWVIDALYTHDAMEAFRLLTNARTELASPLEEDAYRFRQGRLADMGFPDQARAQSIFRAQPFTATTGSQSPAIDTPHASQLPAVYASVLHKDPSLLGQALSHVDDQELLQRLEGELIFLVNSAVIALGIAPRDLNDVRQAGALVRDTISLGIEDVLGHPPQSPDIDEAAGTLLNTTKRLVDFLQHGLSLLEKLRQHAAEVARNPVIHAWAEVPESAQEDYGEERLDRRFLEAARRRCPVYSGWDVLKPERQRPFATLDDVNQAHQRLDALRHRLQTD